MTVRSFATLSGLGDAFFAYPVIAHFAALGPVRVSTSYPEVFAGLANIEATKEKIQGATALRYSRASGRNYYEDVCACAGLPPLPFIGPKIIRPRHPLFWASFPEDRPVCLIKEPSAAHMDRFKNNYRMAPLFETVQGFILDNRERFFFVSVEHETNDYVGRLVGVDLRLSSLSVPSYIFLCSIVHHIASQVGHLLPIAQAFNKPLTVFRPRGPLDGFTKNLTMDQVLVMEKKENVKII